MTNKHTGASEDAFNFDTPASPPQLSNPALARNIAAAQSEYAANQLQGFQDQLGRLKRATVNRDVNPAGRQHYNLVHRETVAYAERVAIITNKPQQVPRFLAPPNVSAEYETVAVPKFDLGLYEERKDQRNLPPSVRPNFADPASDQHQNWLSAQSVPPIAEDVTKTPDENAKARRARAGVK